MLRKNVAGQFVHVQGVSATTGGILSGATWTVRRCLDGTFAAATGTMTEDSTNGWYKFALSQADTNGNDVGYNFTATGAIPQTINDTTTACDPTTATNFGITSLPTTAVTTNGSLITAGTGTSQINPSAGGVDIQTIKTNAVVNGGTITFPTGATLASTTNITAGTIATVTNLTNAPTAGDFTATMKASITTAVPTVAGIATGVWTDTTAGDFTTALSIGKSVLNGVALGTGLTVNNLTNAPTNGDFTATMKTSIGTAVAASAVASVTGNVGGNVAGSVGSVTAGVTVTTNNDKTGYALTTGNNTTIAGAVWDVTLSSHLTAGSTGAALNAAGSAGDPWQTALPGAYMAGQAGFILGTNLDAAVSSRLAASGYTAPDNADIALIKAKTDSLTFTVPGYADVNIRYVNSVAVNGAGTSGSPWGP